MEYFTYTTIVVDGHVYYDFINVKESDIPPGTPLFLTKENAIMAADYAKSGLEYIPYKISQG